MHLGTNYKDMLVRARSYKLVGNDEAEYKAGALGADVQRPYRAATHLVLKEAPRPGKGHVRGHGGENDEVDCVGRHPCLPQRLLGRRYGERRRPHRFDGGGATHADRIHLRRQVVSKSENGSAHALSA